MEWGQIIVALVGLITGVGGTAFTLNKQNKKLGADAEKAEADAADVLVASALTLLGPLRDEIETLKSRVLALETERKIDRELVGMLSQQLTDLGHKPVSRLEARQRLGL